MKTSLVISTYNWPKALNVVLKSVLIQEVLPDEIVIADDGSTEETRSVIQHFIKQCSIPTKHIWHEDEGFRKSTILNKAIKEASGNYIIQVDGDCILHKNFVEDHITNIEKGTYLFGSRVNIKKEAAFSILENEIIGFKSKDKSIRNKTRAIYSPFLSKAFTKNDTLSEKYRGCNTSFFKSDFEAINGYNENFTGWGREDSELALRLHNFGLKGKRLRYCGIVYHIYHKELSRKQLQVNDSIEKATILEKKTWTENGYNKHIKYKEYTKKDVCIVIPIYKSDLTEIEKISLEQCIKILSDYDIYFIEPFKLDSSKINFNNRIISKKFDDSFFQDILSYNKLLLSNVFYSNFSSYKYMLVYQLDCYVFSDRLLYWCNKNYDYIGAPWIASKETVIKKMLSTFDSHQKRRRSKIFFKVGNGGFSLRKVNTFCEITSKNINVINKELKRDKEDYKLMEDVFWSFSAPKLYPEYKIPDYKRALKFSIDRKPKLALLINKNRLPFGCHGINKPKVIDFWKKIIPEMSEV